MQSAGAVQRCFAYPRLHGLHGQVTEHPRIINEGVLISRMRVKGTQKTGTTVQGTRSLVIGDHKHSTSLKSGIFDQNHLGHIALTTKMVQETRDVYIHTYIHTYIPTHAYMSVCTHKHTHRRAATTKECSATTVAEAPPPKVDIRIHPHLDMHTYTYRHKS
jgi:hypothetical protein